MFGLGYLEFERPEAKKKLMTSLTTCSFAPVSEFRTADLDLGVTNLSDIVNPQGFNCFKWHFLKYAT